MQSYKLFKFLFYSTKSLILAIIRAIVGHEYYVLHIDGNKVKYFPCTNLQDALEWTACALNSDKVKIIDRNGYFVAQRAVK